MLELPPGLLLIVGGLVLLALPGRLRAIGTLVLPLVSLVLMLRLEDGATVHVELLGHTATLVRVDALSMVFGAIFHLAIFVAALFAFHVRDPWQQVSGLVYGGSTIGAVFAGDLTTLFVFWELVAFSSTFQILARRSTASYRAGFRYLMVQLVSGLLLAGGAALHYADTGSLAFEAMTLGSPGTWLIFLSFGLKCGWPVLHGWIVDAYPASTATGGVFLSAFTTKLAVYALARGFPGTELLIGIGGAMVLFSLVYAVIENDLRRVLCYIMINQVGFMMVGIGIGSDLALNGTAAHAFCHILYKSVLFMSMGAVLHRTGTVEGSELGGLGRAMPWTAALCLLGGACSSFPLTCGFVSKSMILSAAAYEGHTLIWFLLLFAAAGVFLQVGLRIPLQTFFGRDRGLRPAEAPWNMLAAMGLTVALCLVVGCAPQLLYAHLPFDTTYQPYDTTHVVTQLQVLLWAGVAYLLLRASKVQPRDLRATNLDFDGLYRRGGPAFLRFVEGPLMRGLGAISTFVHETVPSVLWRAAKNPPGAMMLLWDRLRLAGVSLVGSRAQIEAREAVFDRDRFRYEARGAGAAWPIGNMVLYAALLFAVYLLVELF